MPPRFPAAFEAGRGGGHAGAVEAETVDHRLILAQAEQAGPWIARLRLGRDGADLDETEARAQHRVDDTGVLVESGGKANGIGEIPSPHAAGEHGIVPRRRRRHEAQPECPKSEPMGGLGGEKA